jgi:hypothetical protein
MNLIKLKIKLFSNKILLALTFLIWVILITAFKPSAKYRQFLNDKTFINTHLNTMSGTNIQKDSIEEWSLEDKGVLMLPFEKYYEIGYTSTFRLIDGYTHVFTTVFDKNKTDYLFLVNNKTGEFEKKMPLNTKNLDLEKELCYDNKLYFRNLRKAENSEERYFNIHELDILNFTIKEIYSSIDNKEITNILTKNGISHWLFNPKSKEIYFNDEKSNLYILSIETNTFVKLKGCARSFIQFPLENNLMILRKSTTSDEKKYIRTQTHEEVVNPQLLPLYQKDYYKVAWGAGNDKRFVNLFKNNNNIVKVPLSHSRTALVIADESTKTLMCWNLSTEKENYSFSKYEMLTNKLHEYFGYKKQYQTATNEDLKQRAKSKMDAFVARFVNQSDIECYKENDGYVFISKYDLDRYSSYSYFLSKYKTSINKENFAEKRASAKKEAVRQIAQSLNFKEVDIQLKSLEVANPYHAYSLGAYIQDSGQTIYTFWDDMFYKISKKSSKVQLYQSLFSGYRQVVQINGDTFLLASEDRVHMIEMSHGKIIKELVLKDVPLGIGTVELELDTKGRYLQIRFNTVIPFQRDYEKEPPLYIHFDLINNKLLEDLPTNRDNNLLIRSSNFSNGYSEYLEKDRTYRNKQLPGSQYQIKYNGEIYPTGNERDYYLDLYCKIRIVNPAFCQPNDILGFYREDKGYIEVYKNFRPNTIEGLWAFDLKNMRFMDVKPTFCKDLYYFNLSSPSKKETETSNTETSSPKRYEAKVLYTGYNSDYKLKIEVQANVIYELYESADLLNPNKKAIFKREISATPLVYRFPGNTNKWFSASSTNLYDCGYTAFSACISVNGMVFKLGNPSY